MTTHLYQYTIPFGGNYYWTKHSLAKMAFYGLSESRVKRVLRFPQRTEKGIAPETIASMQTAGSKKHPYEIWVMYQIQNEISKIKNKKLNSKFKINNENVIASKVPAWQSDRKQSLKTRHGLRPRDNRRKIITIISAWKYPGITKPGEPIPIPQDILEEILQNYT